MQCPPPLILLANLHCTTPHHTQDAKDVAFENDLLQDPYNLKNW